MNKKIFLMLLLGLFIFSFASAALTDDIEAYWKLDNNILTDSVNSNDGTNSGTVNISGKILSARDFVRTGSDYIDFGQISSLDTNRTKITVAGWIYVDDISNSQWIISKADYGAVSTISWALGIIGGKFRADVYTTGGYARVDSSTSATTGWHHLAFVFTDGVTDIYLDGAEDNGTRLSTGTGTTYQSTTQNILFGNEARLASSLFFDGRLDEVGIWHKSLSSSEILELYNSGSGLTYPFSPNESTPQVLLISPENNSKEIENLVNFSANITINNGFLHSNQTLYIWNENGTFFKTIQNNETSNNLSILAEYSTNGFIVGDNYLWNVYACGNDSSCNWASKNLTFIRNIISENNITYRNWTIEGGVETFVFNFDRASTVQVETVNISYNGTNYTTSLIKNGDNTIATSLFAVPILNASENLTFFFTVTMQNGDSVVSDTYTQLVKNLLIDDCAIHTNKIFNLTLLSEELQEVITGENATLQVDIKLKSLNTDDVVITYYNQFSDMVSEEICISENLSEIKYSVDAVFRYFSDIHSIESYNLLDFELAQSEIPQHITLYDLLTSDTTKFKVSFKDSSNIPVEDAIISFNRQYVSEGIFKSVERPKTDTNGQLVANLVKDTVLYNIIVTKDGVVLANYENIYAFCEDETTGDCKINLLQDTEDVSFFNYNDSVPVSAELEWNETSRVFTLDFSVKNGGSKNVTIMVKKSDLVSNSTVCSDSLTTSSGTLTCSVPATVGDTGLTVYVYADGVLNNYYQVNISEQSPYGVYGFIVALFFFISFGLMFSENKIALVLGGILGFIAIGMLAFINTGVKGVFISVVYLITSGIILIWKLNKTGGIN